MAKSWNARPAPKPTTITEAARRFHAVAWALAQSLGVPLAEVLRDYSAAVSTVYIEVSKCEVRLPAGVQLPPLAPANGQGEAPEAAPEAGGELSSNADENPAVGRPPEAPAPDEAPAPVAIPQGLPCAGSLIVDLKPAQLSLLLGKLAHLAEAKQGAWAVLLTALRNERQTRLANGRKRPILVPVEGDRHGG